MSDHAAMFRLLERLCKQGGRLNAQPDGWDFALQLRFWRVEGGQLVVKVESHLEPERLAAGSKIWCVFEDLGRTRTFSTRIEEHVLRPDGRLAAFKVSMPNAIASQDRRRAFRVPLIVPNVVTVSLTLGDRMWRPELRNISVTGALLKFHPAVADALPDRGRYELILNAAGTNAKVGAKVVRRAKDGRIAIYFPASTQLGEVVPPPDLGKVVRTLELAWLRRRSGKEKAA